MVIWYVEETDSSQICMKLKFTLSSWSRPTVATVHNKVIIMSVMLMLL